MVHSKQLWLQCTPLILDSLARFHCLHPITFFSPCQTPFLSPTLSVCIKLQISLFFSRSPTLSISLSEHNFSLHLSVCVQFHFLLLMYIHFSFTVPFTVSDSKYFHPFLSFSPCHCLSMPVSSSSQSLSPLHFFLLLSVFICLSGQVGFSEGCTLTWWNGVSLLLRWWRYFAVRITTPDIDGEETQDFRGHHELAGRKGKALKQCTHQLYIQEHSCAWG